VTLSGFYMGRRGVRSWPYACKNAPDLVSEATRGEVYSPRDQIPHDEIRKFLNSDIFVTVVPSKQGIEVFGPGSGTGKKSGGGRIRGTVTGWSQQLQVNPDSTVLRLNRVIVRGAKTMPGTRP